MDPGCGIDRSCTGRVERGDGERDETEHRAIGQGRERGKGGREKERGASVGRQISGSVDDHYRWDESILRKEKRQPAVGSFIKNLAWKMMDISRQESTLR